MKVQMKNKAGKVVEFASGAAKFMATQGWKAAAKTEEKSKSKIKSGDENK